MIANTGSILYLTLCFFCSAASLLSVAASFFLWSLFKDNVIIHTVTTYRFNISPARYVTGLQGVSDLTTFFLKYNQERIRTGGLSKNM